MKRTREDDAATESIDREATGKQPFHLSTQPASDQSTGKDPQGINEGARDQQQLGANVNHLNRDDDELPAGETQNRFSPFDRRRKKNRRHRLIGAIAALIVTAGALVGFYSALAPTRSVKVNISTKQPGRADTNDATATREKTPDDLTTEAIAEIRGAVSKAPATTSSVVSNAANASASLSPVDAQKLAPASPGPPPEITSSENPTDASERETASTSRRNREQSIRFPSDDEHSAKGKVDPKSLRPNGTGVQADVVERNIPRTTGNARGNQSGEGAFNTRVSLSKPTIAPVVLPSFGSVLPVRTLGKIYTLRPGSSIRLELIRYVSGDGWSLPKGTVLIGQVRGSEQDRAFIGITGFIEPSRGRFVRLAGETLGDDGGSGIRGKFHKLSSGWSRAFARVGSAAVNVAGAIAGSRISGQPVIVTDIGSRTISPFSNEVDSSLLQQARGFVEVPAGTAAFVMVTTLPADVEGVDAEPDRLASDAGRPENDNAGQQARLTQEELALLLTSGDPDRIREALPRMSLQMRRIAEVVLAESSHQTSNKE